MKKPKTIVIEGVKIKIYGKIPEKVIKATLKLYKGKTKLEKFNNKNTKHPTKTN